MLVLSPPSARREFDGLPEFFEESLRPYLREREKDRRAAVVNFLIVVGAFGVLALAMLRFGPLGESNLQFSLIIAFGGLALGMFLVNRARGDIANGLFERLCARLGFSYLPRLPRPDYCADFSALKLLPGFNEEAWEDEIRGRHSGARFVLCEAHLKYKTGGKKRDERTVFHGQLLMIDYPKRFLGRTVVNRDMGPLNRFNKPGKEFSHVGLASPEFEKAFEAWSTDQVEARDLLDPLVLERFQELERLFKGRRLRAAFADNRLLIALETGDRLNMGSMFAPLETPARVETILKEFDVVFDLIDAVVKPVEGRMDGAISIAGMKS
jgi:hypothetical protein